MTERCGCGMWPAAASCAASRGMPTKLPPSPGPPMAVRSFRAGATASFAYGTPAPAASCAASKDIPTRCVRLAFSADGKFIVSGSHDGTVRLWDAVKGAEVHSFAGHSGPVTSVAIVRGWPAAALGQPRSHAAAVGRDDRQGMCAASKGTHAKSTRWRSLRTASGQCPEATTSWCVCGMSRRARNCAASRATPTRSSGWRSRRTAGKSCPPAASIRPSIRSLRVWEVESGRELSSFGGAATDRIGCVAFAADGRFALSGGSDPALRLWKLTR